MLCSNCGAELHPAATLCWKCGAQHEPAVHEESVPSTSAGPTGEGVRSSRYYGGRPRVVTLIAAMFFISALLAVCPVLLLLGGSFVWLGSGDLSVAIIGAALPLAIAVGLWQVKPWARWIAIVVAGISTARNAYELFQLAPSYSIDAELVLRIVDLTINILIILVLLTSKAVKIAFVDARQEHAEWRESLATDTLARHEETGPTSK